MKKSVYSLIFLFVFPCYSFALTSAWFLDNSGPDGIVLNVNSSGMADMEIMVSVDNGFSYQLAGYHNSEGVLVGGYVLLPYGSSFSNVWIDENYGPDNYNSNRYWSINPSYKYSWGGGQPLNDFWLENGWFAPVIVPPVFGFAALFEAVQIGSIADNLLLILLSLTGIGLMFLAFKKIRQIFETIGNIREWNKMIDRRNKNMGSSGWKYNKWKMP